VFAAHYDQESITAGVRKAWKQWTAWLRDGYERSRYDSVSTQATNSTSWMSIKGYRLWRGSYRGVDIALYSCAVVNRLAFPKVGGGLYELRIVLATEESGAPACRPDYKGPALPRQIITPVAQKIFAAEQIDTKGLVMNPNLRPAEQVIEAGRIRIDVRGGDGGKLEFRLHALRKPEWAKLDLEIALGKFKLNGPKKLVDLSPPKLSGKQFAERTIAVLKTFERGREPWDRRASSEECLLVDHPLWENPAAMKQLLENAQAEELTDAVSFMKVKLSVDPGYLNRLEAINATLLALGDHKSREVRRAFGGLLFWSFHWPRDIHVLEGLLLKSTERDVIVGILGAFWKRKAAPNDRGILKKLEASDDKDIRYWARSVADR